MSCGNWAWFDGKRVTRFFCGYCERPECIRLFWFRRVRLLAALVKEHGLNKFFTLTLDPNILPVVEPVVDTWKYISEPWSRMRKRLRRRFPHFKFVAVLEKHKQNDRPHIHGFTNVWLSQSEWSVMWNECGGGKIVWVEKVQSEEVSEYVGKEISVARYVGKDNLAVNRRKTRKLWRSKGMKAGFELKEDKTWCIIKEKVYNENGELSEYGKMIAKENEIDKTE